MSDDSIYERPSKSEQKRALERWRERSELLLTLPAGDLAALELPEELLEEVLESKRITNHAARSRQLGYVTRLVMQADDDVKARIMTRFAPTRRTKRRSVPVE